MRRLIIACLLLTAVVTPALSQTARLRGRLVDRTSKAPIAGAYLRLINLADTTDVRASGSADDGSFSFTGLGLRDYRLLAERIGYSALRQSITVDRADQDGVALRWVRLPCRRKVSSSRAVCRPRSKRPTRQSSRHKRSRRTATRPPRRW